MSGRASPRAIGVFVIAAIGLAVGSVVVFGSGRLFHETHEFVAFFDSSVGGLGAGSPVKYRGVDIGTVTAVFLDIASIPRDPDDNRIPVLFELDADLLAGYGASVDLADPATIDSLIRRGLAASLATESLVTGRQYVALDQYPDRERHFVGTEGTGYTEVPTVLTGLEEIQAKVQDLIANASEVEFGVLFEDVRATIANVRAISDRDDIRTLSEVVEGSLSSFDSTLVAVRGFLASADSLLPQLASNADESVTRLRTSADELDSTLEAVRGAFEPGGRLAYRLDVALRDLAEAASSFRNLANYLERNPSALIRGRPEDNE